MNTVKHWSGSNLPPLRKKQFQDWIKSYIPALLFSSLLGTYLDLVMVGNKLYSFPVRPFSDIFSINLLFTFVGLPVSTLFFLILMQQRRRWIKGGIIVLVSLAMAVLEKNAEKLGMFSHTQEWSHLYTFFGYCLYLTVIDRFHHWISLKN